MAKLEKATFGAGCFWQVEETFRKVKGVVKTTVGYSGGKVKDPDYKSVCLGKTGHVEVTEVVFDPSVILYKQILDIFWKTHDPTQLDKQGPDVGKQYRSIIFYHSQKQKKIAELSKKKLDPKFKNKIVTKIVAAKPFYKAEEHHQKYIMKKKGFASKIKSIFGLR